MKPGLARAVPMGIIGFAAGALIAVLIRLAQGLDPNPAAPFAYVGPAFVLGAFLSAGLFVWGMGAFDPRMNVHGEEHAPEAEAEAAEPEKPLAILGAFTWQITFWTVLFVLIVGAFAFLPQGPTVQSVNEADGNVAAIGMTEVPLPFGGPTIVVSYLTLLIIFFIWTILSLFATAGLLAFLFTYFQAGRKNPEATPIPWRALIFVGIVASLGGLPLIVPSMEVPMALLMPAYVLPPLLLLIAFRHPVWALLLLVTLPLPMLVPNVMLTQLPVALLVFIVIAAVALTFALGRYLLPENLYQPVTNLAFSVTVIAAVGVVIWFARDDFWQLIFLLVLTVLVIGLLMPVSFLKFIIPAWMWDRFSAIRWPLVIPHFAGWLAGVLRHGLPRFLGQK